MKKHFTSLLTTILLVLSILSASSQTINWGNTPEKGFVFQINNDEAQKLLSHKMPDTLVYDLLYNQVDTFEIQKGWKNRPSKGHFILVKIVGNKMECEYACVFPYQVFLFKEYDALALQVLDLAGNVRKDAIVKFKFRRLRIDPDSRTYRIQNAWFYGNHKMVTIELDGFRSAFNIQRHKVPSWEHNYNYDDGPNFYSYMITDKNKYRPDDKVRFKSYALSQHKQALRKKLDLWLTGYGKRIQLDQIEPYRPGGYAGEIQLHDSLELKLDTYYSLQLKGKNGRIVAECSFKYEDYELFGNKLSIQLEKDRQYGHESNILTIRGTDINGLMLKDARASILIKALNIQKSFMPIAILSDTLMIYEMDLNPVVPTEIKISPELFQQTNTSYQVEVTVLNKENERLYQSDLATFYYSQYELSSWFSNDSICFDLLKNNISMKNEKMILKYNDDLQGKEITMPYKERLNPANKVMSFKNDFIQEHVELKYLNPVLKLEGGIQKDSFNIQLYNPQQIDITWHIYKGNQEIGKGFGKEIDFKYWTEDFTQKFYVELFYSLGGKEHVKRKQYSYKEEYLDVSLDIPDRIYPGQKVDAAVRVVNQLGEPVSGVDLTALSFTSKLDYYLPDLPYYGKSSSSRSKKAHYSKQGLDKFFVVLDLDYEKWKKIASLDTMIYYQYTYPGNKMFFYSFDISDGTQIAPFIMQGGAAKDVYVIELNHRPVYYSWTSPHEYSFYVNPNIKYEITFRLHDKVVILDSLQFEKGKKTIMSFDLDHLPTETKVHKLKTFFSDFEKSRHRPYISEFGKGYESYSYLRFTSGIIPLFGRDLHRYSSTKTVGPIPKGKLKYINSRGLKTIFNHIGGYRYAFEDNIVYKSDVSSLLPGYLYDLNFDPLSKINDLVLKEHQFLEMQKMNFSEFYFWHANIIDIVKPKCRIKFKLPRKKDTLGIIAVLFQSSQSGKIASAYYKKWDYYSRYSLEIPNGYNNLIVLYEDAGYLKMDSVHLKQNIIASVNMNYAKSYGADSISRVWISQYALSDRTSYRPIINKPKPQTYFQYFNATGNTNGVVTDEEGMGLPGVTVLVRGTDIGTVTDLDGRYSIQVDDPNAILIFSFVGMVSQEIEVSRGSEIGVQMEADQLALDEVVVVGYGVQHKEYLSGAVASVRPEKLSNITKDDFEGNDQEAEASEEQEFEQQLYQELLNLNNIRSNFSDVGFWEPCLYTNKKGESKFAITFPDDITQWDAIVYAMNRRLQTGTFRKKIKSYKPLMAELHTPRFLTRGDSAMFVGKLLNYTSDSSIVGKVQWEGADSDFEKDLEFKHFYSDKLIVNPTSLDTITGRYVFERNDGYFDGEERKVPVVEQGIIRADGSLSIFNNGESKYVNASNNEKVYVEIVDNQLNIYAGEVRYLTRYRYACNEQLASKLIGLVNYERIMQYEGKEFKQERHICKIIRRLLKNQNKEFLWSWWNKSENTSYWMSAHILRALKFAKDAGYKVDLDIKNVARKATYKFDFLKSISLYDIDLLHALANCGAELNYPTYITKLDSIVARKDSLENCKRYYRKSFLKEKLLLQEIRQILGMKYQRDSLLAYKKESALGEVFFSDGKLSRYWYNDEFATNLVAYRIIKNDSLLSDLKLSMQMYFLSSRKGRRWNTYQSSNAVMNILPDLLSQGVSKNISAKIKVTGKEDTVITKFPYKVILEPNEELHLEKESGMPVYYQEYVKERVTKAKTGVEGFKIRTYFENNINVLKAGEPIKLIVNVEVAKESFFENVMIEVPIPGACSYADKDYWKYYRGETHREYFKDRTVIFLEKMNSGNYSFTIHLLPRFTGKYLINPAQVSLMYIPVVNANTDMKRVEVND